MMLETQDLTYETPSAPTGGCLNSVEPQNKNSLKTPEILTVKGRFEDVLCTYSSCY